MTRAAIERAVGLAAMGAVIVAFVATGMRADWGIFEIEREVHVRFADVAFLEPGNIVRSNGLTVGRVRDLELEPAGVLATLAVDRELVIREDYRIHVRALSVLGGRYVEIVPGSRIRARVATSRREPLAGTPEPEIGANLGEIGERTAPMIASAVANVRDALDKVSEAQGTLGLALNDEALGENIRAVTQRLERTSSLVGSMSRKVEEATGTLGKLVNAQRFARAREAVSAHAGSIGDKVASGTGTIGALATDERLLASLEAAREHLASVADALDPEGGALGRATGLREKLDRAVERLDRLMTKVSSGRGPLLVVARDPDVQADIDRTRESLEAFSLRPRTSTLGRLAEDRQLLAELEHVFLEMRESAVDAGDVPPMSATLQGQVRLRLGIGPEPRPGPVSRVSPGGGGSDD